MEIYELMRQNQREHYYWQDEEVERPEIKKAEAEVTGMPEAEEKLD